MISVTDESQSVPSVSDSSLKNWVDHGAKPFLTAGLNTQSLAETHVRAGGATRSLGAASLCLQALCRPQQPAPRQTCLPSPLMRRRPGETSEALGEVKQLYISTEAPAEGAAPVLRACRR